MKISLPSNNPITFRGAYKTVPIGESFVSPIVNGSHIYLTEPEKTEQEALWRREDQKKQTIGKLRYEIKFSDLSPEFQQEVKAFQDKITTLADETGPYPVAAEPPRRKKKK